MSKIRSHYDCPLLLTNDLLGGKWKLRILWHILHGDNRFSMLTKAIPGITEKVLSSQLKELESSGMLIKEVVQHRPSKVIRYHLNQKHAKIIPIIEAIFEFTRDYGIQNGFFATE